MFSCGARAYIATLRKILITITQAGNQLGIPGGAKSFLRGAQIF